MVRVKTFTALDGRQAEAQKEMNDWLREMKDGIVVDFVTQSSGTFYYEGTRRETVWTFVYRATEAGGD